MLRPKFIKKQIDGRFEYHLPVTYERFIYQTIFDNSKFNLENEVKDDLFSFINQNNISSFIGWDENSLLYSIALRTLANQKKCFLIYFDSPNAISEIQPNSSATKAEWWSSIQFMQGDQFCQYFGFQSPETFLNVVNYSNKDLANRYFYISEIGIENINRYTKAYNSDVTNWFFIFCEIENEHTIKSIMTNKNERPSLDLLLESSSSIVNIQIGGDEGYLDYVLIQSKTDIGDLIQDIESKQHVFIQEYEEVLKECKPFDDEWKVDFYKERVTEIIKNCG
jgi:hypothetical protein